MHRYAPIALALIGCGSTTPSESASSRARLAETPLTTLDGYAPDDLFGSAVANAGDVDGDGYADVIVGAWGYSYDHGRTYLFRGSPSGLESTYSAVLEYDSDDEFGRAVDGIGDVNRDGYDDVIVGLPSYGSSYNVGAAQVYFGSAEGLDTTPAVMWQGSDVESRFGASVAGIGDFNGDGYPDVVVGEPTVASGYPVGTSPGPQPGAVYLFLGSATGFSTIPAARWTVGVADTADGFGISVDGAGDVNRDGYTDVIAGADLVGKVYVFLGGATIPTTPAVVLEDAESGSTTYGSVVTGAGDVNDDGYADVLVGDPDYDVFRGKLYLYLGSASGVDVAPVLMLEGVDEGTRFGAAMCGIDDVDGDGFDDFMVGSRYDDGTDRGAAYFYRGSATIPSGYDAIWLGETEGDLLGFAVGGGGDVDGDGARDVLVGAPGHDASTGRVYLFEGDVEEGDTDTDTDSDTDSDTDADTDSDTDADTDSDTDSDTDADDTRVTCGCATNAASPLWLGGIAMLLAARRRRS